MILLESCQPRTHIFESQLFSGRDSPPHPKKSQVSRSIPQKEILGKKYYTFLFILILLNLRIHTPNILQYPVSSRSKIRGRKGGEGIRESEFVEFLRI